MCAGPRTTLLQKMGQMSRVTARASLNTHAPKRARSLAGNKCVLSGRHRALI